MQVCGWRWRGSRAAHALLYSQEQTQHKGRWERGQTSPLLTSPWAHHFVREEVVQIIKLRDRKVEKSPPKISTDRLFQGIVASLTKCLFTCQNSWETRHFLLQYDQFLFADVGMFSGRFFLFQFQSAFSQYMIKSNFPLRGNNTFVIMLKTPKAVREDFSSWEIFCEVNSAEGCWEKGCPLSFSMAGNKTHSNLWLSTLCWLSLLSNLPNLKM